jgi:hypothetical protein
MRSRHNYHLPRGSNRRRLPKELRRPIDELARRNEGRSNPAGDDAVTVGDVLGAYTDNCWRLRNHLPTGRGWWYPCGQFYCAFCGPRRFKHLVGRAWAALLDGGSCWFRNARTSEPVFVTEPDAEALLGAVLNMPAKAIPDYLYGDEVSDESVLAFDPTWLTVRWDGDKTRQRIRQAARAIGCEVRFDGRRYWLTVWGETAAEGGWELPYDEQQRFANILRYGTIPLLAAA